MAFVLRGRGGGRSCSAAAQGVLFAEVAYLALITYS
jgi:hypothetical protein